MSNRIYPEEDAVRFGFTLIEVLMAMLISSFLVLGLHGAYRQARQLRSVVENERLIYESSDRVMECLRTELAGAYLPVLDSDAKAFALATEADGSCELTFYTLSSAWRTGAECARSARIRYRFTKGATARENTLERFEQWCAGERVITKEERDVLLTGPFELSAWVMAPGTDRSEESLKASYEAHDQAPRATKLLLRWRTEPDTAGTTFSILVSLPSESLIQEPKSQDG